MVTQSWMFDSIIYIYALSLLFYFSDFLGSNRKAKRMGTGLLVFVWVMQTVYLLLSFYQHSAYQIYSMFETLFFFSWLLVGASLVINRFYRMELFLFLVNVFGFSVLALNIFSNPGVRPTLGHWEISDELLFIHITLSVGSYTAFVVSAVFSGMYLFLHRKLKGKQWSDTMKRMPSLEKMDRFTSGAVLTGAPLLILALALGLIWVVLEGSLALLLDFKVLSSIAMLIIYLVYLYLRLSRKAPARKLAIWNLLAFSLVVANFMVSNWLSAFHQWIWM